MINFVGAFPLIIINFFFADIILTANYKSYSILSLNTSITFASETSCDASIIENVEFELIKGDFNILTRRLSLKPNVNDFLGFRALSSDIQILDTSVIPGCENYNIGNSESFYEDICVVVSFVTVSAMTFNKNIRINYQYTGVSILKTYNKPFSSQIYNIFAFTFDNAKKDVEIKNVVVQVIFNYKNNSLSEIDSNPNNYELIYMAPPELPIGAPKPKSEVKKTIGFKWTANEISKGSFFQIQTKFKQVVSHCENFDKPRSLSVQNNDLISSILTWLVFSGFSVMLIVFFYHNQINALKRSRPKVEKQIKKKK